MTNQTEQSLNPVIWLVPLVNGEPYNYIIYGWTDFRIQELSFDTELQLALISPPPNSATDHYIWGIRSQSMNTALPEQGPW